MYMYRNINKNGIILYGHGDRQAHVNKTSQGYDIWVERNNLNDDLGAWIWFGVEETPRQAIEYAAHVLRKIHWMERGKPRKWH